MKKIRLEIGALVLDGIDRKDAAQVGRAVESQLARLIEEGGSGGGGGGGLSDATRDIKLDSVHGAPISVRRGQSVQSIGASIARSVYGSLGDAIER